MSWQKTMIYCQKPQAHWQNGSTNDYLGDPSTGKHGKIRRDSPRGRSGISPVGSVLNEPLLPSAIARTTKRPALHLKHVLFRRIRPAGGATRDSLEDGGSLWRSAIGCLEICIP